MNAAARPHDGADAPPQPAARGISVLLLSVMILVLGNSLQSTLIGVRGGCEGISPLSIGIMMSAYFAGFVTGSSLLSRLIVLVGHIRTYAALASIASAITLAYLLAILIPAWIAFRFLQGLCYSGMILVVESWLNGCATRKNRGGVLAGYGLLTIPKREAASGRIKQAFLLLPRVSFVLHWELVRHRKRRVTMTE
jgi:MFS family permease